MTRVQPHALPSATDTSAATVSVKKAAPGLRRTRPPSTPGMSHTPYMKARPGSGMASAGPFQSRPQAQNMTPNAAAMTAATTMSTVRHRRVDGDVMRLPPSPDEPGEDARHDR